MQRGLMLLALAASSVSAQEFHMMAQKVNSAGRNWVAEVPTRFNSSDDVAQLCGTWMPGHPKYVKLPEHPGLEGVQVPASFDARAQWPKCTVIGEIRDQSACGSCWAFGSTETFEDRRCAQTGVNTMMAAEDTASCCSGFACGFSQGCDGGQPGAALQWMTSTGVVTGGLYKGSGCRPYTLAPCAHHVPATAKYPKCPAQEYPTPQCTKHCVDGSNYEQNKAKGKNAYSVTGVTRIEQALQKGTVSAAFTVYADFPTYKSGVYKHTSGSALGGHAVAIIGYGTEGGEAYWLVKNSWNNEWGAAGLFKILKGADECGIESSISAIDF